MHKSFRNAGDLGRVLSEVDWEATGLGDPEHWPQSLKTAVRTMLASKFSMWMAWGPDLIFFCNDAYRRDTLGTKYPWALGRPFAEVWAEVLEEVEPRISQVMTTGEASWDERLQLFLERSGYVEETYHTFSYSPLDDDDGAVVGLLCVVAEVTHEVVGQRRLEALSDLATSTAEALTVADTLEALSDSLGRSSRALPFTLLYLADEDAADDSLRLAASTGFDGPHPAAPPFLTPGAGSPWPVEALLAGESRLVPDLDALPVPLPGGAWSEAPLAAYALPLSTGPGDRPLGLLILGLNRYRPFDTAYRDFVGLVAGHVTGALARAVVHETAAERAAELEHLDQAKTTFFTNVSHELRTPLTLLLGPAQDALADIEHPLPAAQRGRVELVSRNAVRLLKLVNTLLDFTRMHSEGSTHTFARTPLSSLTRELAEQFDAAMTRAGLDFVVRCEPLELDVYVDADLWSKLVLNLLSNALKFTFGGTVTISLTEVEGMAQLEVSDTGTGIAVEDQADLFKRFHRVIGARSRSHEGSGVGLALVADIVALHGGSVAVHSEPGLGSTFTVRVPFGTEHLPHAVEQATGTSVARHAAPYVEETRQWVGGGRPTQTDAPRTSTDSGGGPRLLVVDDNPDMREYLVHLLSPDYEVDVAADGMEALERARRRRPDLVLSDVMMPHLDGVGLMRELHADPAMTGVPVVLVSARAGEDGAIEGLEAGADDYLMKPFTARELRARVRANLELDRARRTRLALERSHRMLEEAQRLAQLGSWEVDLETGRVIVTDEALHLVGLTRQALESSSITELVEGLIHPDDRSEVVAALRRAEAGETVAYVTRVVRPDGEERLLRARAEFAPADQDRHATVVGSVQDITEQVSAERALTAARAAQEAAAREHAIASELQASLLPHIPQQVAGVELASFYQPGVEGTQVGGDWYDVLELDDDRVALVIGDVMGRGVSAAAVMGQLRSAIRAYARLDVPPHRLMDHLDDIVRGLDKPQMVTCVYAVYAPADGTVTIANAGHLPPLRIAADGTTDLLQVNEGGPPLGVGRAGYGQDTADLRDGDSLVLYTDGLVEHRDSDLDVGLAALSEAGSAWRGGVHGLAQHLASTLLQEDHGDDVAVLAAQPVRRREPTADEPPADTGLRSEPADATPTTDGASPTMTSNDRAVAADHHGERDLVHAPLPMDASAPRIARQLVREVLAAEHVPEDVLADAALVVSELASNAVRHGTGPVELTVHRADADHVSLMVRDGAPTQPVAQEPHPDGSGGRGLTLVSAISSRWGCYSHGTGKVVWCLLNARERQREGAYV
ncbi:SpoIIE family protein phosphatase [Luteipulveratus sp. YIM 133132]|uniref:SpoIIE family protein phosphatase n=1 Tax=Luteipulveratus flavus TaxID=3031728 RepID=UPI0023B05602|nr:SpoIIE family protein phosphatase [Luteipulveratus sp. YIM 133132]MDE9367798.1 SpoIIE family protein phosphatase [Luteipulveratus sp. YIM 133132]